MRALIQAKKGPRESAIQRGPLAGTLVFMCFLAFSSASPDHAFSQRTEVRELIQKAEHGDAKAQVYLGTRYKEGMGVIRDREEAIKWLSKEAESTNGREVKIAGASPGVASPVSLPKWFVNPKLFERVDAGTLEARLKSGADPDERDENGRTTLIMASIRDRPDIVRVLLKFKADPNAKDKNGNTALIEAAGNNFTYIVRLLLAAGADVNAANREGKTALSIARGYGHENVVQLLVNASAEGARKTQAAQSIVSRPEDKRTRTTHSSPPDRKAVQQQSSPEDRTAQTKEEGIRLFNEAKALKEKARNRSDLENAVAKYEQALKIFERVGFKQGIHATAHNLGGVYLAWGQHPKAVEYYEKSLEIAKNIGDVKGEGDTLNKLGNVYLAWGKYPKAVGCYEKSLEIAKKVRDVEGEASALGNLGIVYYYWGRYSKAVEYYENALKIAKKVGDVKGEASALNLLGLVYSAWGQYSKAVEYYEKGLEIAKKAGDVKTEANALGNLGAVYAAWDQYAKAVEYFEKSLEIAKKAGGVKPEGQILNSLGSVYQQCGKYARAVEYYEKSLEIKKKLGDVRGEGPTLGNLGSVYEKWGQYPKAVEYYEKDLEICRKLSDVRGEGGTLNNLGQVYSAWGQYAKAVQYYEKSLEIRKKIGDVHGEGGTLNNLGLVYATQGEYSQALTHFQKGLEIAKRIGVSADLITNSIGNLYLDMGEVQKAEPFVKEAKHRGSLGRLFLVKADYASAKKYYESLLKSAEQNRNANNLFTAYTGLGRCYEGIDDNSKAADYYIKAVEFTEDLRSSLSPAERETFFDVKINGFYRTAPYEGLARVHVKMSKPLEALKQSEYSRARIFAEAISKRGDYSGLDVPGDVRENDSQLTDELASLSKNLQTAYEKQNKEVIASLEPQVKEAKQKLAAHVDMLRKQYPLFAATRYPQPMGLDKTALQENEWVLSYHVTDPGLIVYLTKGKQLVKAEFKPVPRKEIDALVRKFREPLEMSPKDNPEQVLHKLKSFDFSTGKNLSDLLLGNVLSVLPKDTPVIIVPDDSLGVLPFEMLPLNTTGKIATDKKIPYATGAEFFGDRNLISYYQSITALTLARNYGKQKSLKGKLLVFADPVFQKRDERAQAPQKTSGLVGAQANLYRGLMVAMEEGDGPSMVIKRLPLTSTLADNLAKMYQGSADCYTGLDASKDRFLKEIAPRLVNYDNIVFATHGYFGKDLPGIKEPVLLLRLVPDGTDGYLRMSEVAGLKMNADIVALTACQSGLGKKISGEGTMGMGRAFQYAGAKCVLTSLWSVEQAASVNLVQNFFRHVKDGKTKLGALKLARKEIRDQGYDHPFFWAPFILVGEVN